MADYELEGNLLKVKKDLGWPAEEELREQGQDLLGATEESLIVDLTQVRHICIRNVVVLASLGMMAQNRGKKLTIKGSTVIAPSFKFGGFDEFVTLELLDV